MSATKMELTANRRRLVELMQRVNFGRVEDLRVRKGEPVFDPAPRIFRVVKPGRANGARPETAKTDFDLKAEVTDLFVYLDALADGVIEKIEIQHGLPSLVTFEEAFA